MELRDKKILVTGGGGFMGSHLCAGLVNCAAEVRSLDNFSSGRPANLEDIKYLLKLIGGSIADGDCVRNACAGADAVIHAAFPMAMRERSLETGFVVDFMAGLLNLAKEAVHNNALFIYISSIAVYGNQKYVPLDENHPLKPILLHGALKLSGEYLCQTLSQSHGLRFVVLRVADIYGPRNTRINVPVRFLLNALAGEPIKVAGTGKQSRTYTYVEDFVTAVKRVLETPSAIGQTLNIASDQEISIYDLAVLAREVTGSTSPIIIDQTMPSDDRRLAIDGTLAKNVLSLMEPVSIKEGLIKTRNWLIQNPGFYV